MRLIVHPQDSRRVDLGIALRGRQAGVTEQLLDLPQVGAVGEQMRCKAMAEASGFSNPGRP